MSSEIGEMNPDSLIPRTCLPTTLGVVLQELGRAGDLAQPGGFRRHHLLQRKPSLEAQTLCLGLGCLMVLMTFLMTQKHFQ